MTYGSVEAFRDSLGDQRTLDLTPPTMTITGVSTAEASITVTLKLDEIGTAWCRAVYDLGSAPTGTQIRELGYSATVPLDPTVDTTAVISALDRWDQQFGNSLARGTDYDVYCYAEDDLCTACRTTNAVGTAA